MNSIFMALLILLVTIALLIWEPIPIVVTAIGASILYAYTGIIEVNTIFSGYNSTTIVLLALLFGAQFGGFVTLVAAQNREIGAGHGLLLTDFGQMNSPGSVDGLMQFVHGLLEQGIDERDIEKMIKDNPAALLGSG